MRVNEIELKFLVEGDDWKEAIGAAQSTQIDQRYLPDVMDDQSNWVRLSITPSVAGHSGNQYLTFYVKTPSSNVIVRTEIDGHHFAEFGLDNLAKLLDERGIVKVEKKKIEARVRKQDGEYKLTIKAKTDRADTRGELEFPIDSGFARTVFASCKLGTQKTRYTVPAGNGLRWEIDEFTGRNAGLVTAEIELNYQDQEFDRPVWLSKNVTEDKRYSNRSLAEHPMPTEGLADLLPREKVAVLDKPAA